MNKYHDIEVIINNKRYTLSGYESEEYLQKIASYINNKHAEFRNKDAYKFLDSELKNILMQINIADDYFKTTNKLKEIETESDAKSKEIFDLKHELISARTKLEAAEREVDELKSELHEAQKNIVRLETELGDNDK
ncbi:cell division protein ZapA [Lachnospiraceae bacterium MD1]|jgi:cell division protein ZapA|uniref:Cell division protein ZapA n=1 Tax=Variimorphobacter saccharofermentans TaxID=2755051 RepID=A0A839K3P7_9FIRM|nr:cell division protein ZapA [Variimorphobacter saccharofermentans]MBB2183639.1 cell division protein ZapA [Variimorphobacter saccharofermentans]